MPPLSSPRLNYPPPDRGTKTVQVRFHLLIMEVLMQEVDEALPDCASSTWSIAVCVCFLKSPISSGKPSYGRGVASYETATLKQVQHCDVGTLCNDTDYSSFSCSTLFLS